MACPRCRPSVPVMRPSVPSSGVRRMGMLPPCCCCTHPPCLCTHRTSNEVGGALDGRIWHITLAGGLLYLIFKHVLEERLYGAHACASQGGWLACSAPHGVNPWVCKLGQMCRASGLCRCRHVALEP